MLRCLLVPAACVVLTLAVSAAARADEDPLDHAKSLLDLGKALVEAGTDMDDPKRIEEGLAKFREAKALFEKELEKPGLSEAQKNRIRLYIVDVESRIDWYGGGSIGGGGGGGEQPDGGEDDAPAAEGGVATGEVRIPEMKRGERFRPWCRRVRKIYEETDDPHGRAALARGMARQARVLALPTLFALFKTEQMPDARDGVFEALAMVGTSRVAHEMASYARADREAHWDDALEVIYLCLKKPERYEREKPFMRAIRAFHKLKNRKLTLQILRDLDAMGGPGVAALGEVIYVPDFGYHDHAVQLLSNKRDRRAVPPLVFKMNRFKFEYRVQIPAHEALLKMGWYAVPELVDRLNDKAAGIWISWTLRKITGETMGTDKRKWHDWWKTEKLRHPELFDDPDERPPVVTGEGESPR
jgi:hypothetical protein